jgi:hypothetical protein
MGVVMFVTRMGQTQVCAGRRGLRLDERSAHCNILAQQLRDGSGMRSSVAPLEQQQAPRPEGSMLYNQLPGRAPSPTFWPERERETEEVFHRLTEASTAWYLVPRSGVI